MNVEPVPMVVLAAYATLALELCVLAVPSEASTRQLLASTDPSTGGALGDARARRPADKLLRFALPMLSVVAAFLIPLVAVFYPTVIRYLAPIEVLQRPAVAWLGVALIVLGRVVTLLGAARLRRHGAGELLTGGVFRLTRNPILVGLYLFYLGACLVFPCVVLFAWFVPIVAYMHRRVRMEESLLIREHGDRYTSYCREVPRYFPF